MGQISTQIHAHPCRKKSGLFWLKSKWGSTEQEKKIEPTTDEKLYDEHIIMSLIEQRLKKLFACGG